MRNVVTRLALAMVLGTGAVTLAAGDAHAAVDAFLQLKGQDGTMIKGGVIQKGREGWVRVVSFDHKLISSLDASGKTRKREHKPLVVTIELDQAMPALMTAWASNQVLKEVKLPVFMPNKLGAAGGAGNATLAYEITLTNASIASIEIVSSVAGSGGKDQLVVSFSYQAVEWTWKLGAKTATDKWSS